MKSIKKRILIFALSASLAVSLGVASAQTSGENSGIFDIPGGLVPDDNTAGPVANVGAEYKFDDGFYQKIQDLILAEPQPGDFGVYDGERYYNVIMVVGRGGINPDDTATQNKDAIVRYLNTLGARDIASAESLSFVTASIPVSEIPGFSSHDEIYAMGDGEMPVTVEVDTARQTIHATPSDLQRSIGWVPDGTGVVVAVVDRGINSTYLNNKVVKRAYCYGDCGAQPSEIIQGYSVIDSRYSGPVFAGHGTRVAQILAASGMPNHNGISPGVTLLDAMYSRSSDNAPNFHTDEDVIRHYVHSGFVHAIDWSYTNGADVVNISAGAGRCSVNVSSHNLIINEAVDKGMVVVKSAGNYGLYERQANYTSISNPGCAHNVIAVGGINDRSPSSAPTMYENSSRGPVSDSDKRLVPHIAAPAYNIQVLEFTINATTGPHSGTSYAAPQVSATVAMMLQAEPELTPAEVKAALLLGADWKGPVPCTSAQYEQDNANDNCSYARQPTSRTIANSAASLGILNNVGFGILNTAKSLKYANTSSSYVISDHFESRTTPKRYWFWVSDTSDPVKIILTWMVHPHGNITEQMNRNDAVPISDLRFTVIPPAGNARTYVNSANQTTEFAVFHPPVTGYYWVYVYDSTTDVINKPVQAFAIASTRPLTASPSSNEPPVAQSNELIVRPGMETPVRFSATDPDGDAVSFYVSRDPMKGNITTDEMITKTVSRAIYTPENNFAGTDTFEITPYDGMVPGSPATTTLRAESLPSGATDATVSSTNVRYWDAHDAEHGFIHTDYTKQIAGKSYSVSALQLGSVNMEGVNLAFTTTGGSRYTAAMPSNGTRMIEFATPITIRSATLSADAIGEEAADHNRRSTSDREQVRMFVGYVPSSCTTSSSISSCPAQATYTATTEPSLPIRDSIGLQSTVSTMRIPEDGAITALSVSVDIDHNRIGDLKVILTSPDGTQITLHNRAGGSGDDIRTTYSSSTNAALAALVGFGAGGTWTLSVGDYFSSYAGTLNSWTVSATYDPSGPATIFSDDFETSSTLVTKWAETGEGDWRTSTSPINSVPVLPGHSASNRVLHSDNCDTSCTLTLRNPIDLTRYSSATLSFWRFVDVTLDAGEYLRVQLYDGSNWHTVYNWHNGRGDDSRWHKHSYDLASYLDSTAFKMRLVTRQSDTREDVQLDDIRIIATPAGGNTATPEPPTNPPAPPQRQSVYVADTDDHEVLVFSTAGAYLDTFVDRRAGGLGKVWDISFGPDGHLYASDNTYKKIRKYNGATGLPISLSSGWASTIGIPYGLTWKDNILYVATNQGVERFTSSGSALGYFGDASRSPPNSGATALSAPYDIAFCSDNRMYVSDRALDKILYYRASDGRYLDQISGTSSSPPNTHEAAGLECGPALSSSGTSLYQSGDDPGRINEISLSGSLVRAITSPVDEPYGMDMDGSTLYVANKDDDNILKIISGGTTSVFVFGNRMDDPRGVSMGPEYSSASGASGESPRSLDNEIQNDEPEFVVTYNGAVPYGAIPVTGNLTTLEVQATDPEGDPITITTIPDDLMPEVTVSATDHTNGTATITVNSAGAGAGTYVLWIKVADDQGNYDREPYAMEIGP